MSGKAIVRFSGRNSAGCWKELEEVACYNPLIFASRLLLPSLMHRNLKTSVISLRGKLGKQPSVHTQGTEAHSGSGGACRALGGAWGATASISHSQGPFHSPDGYSDLTTGLFSPFCLRFLCQVQCHMPSSKSQHAYHQKPGVWGAFVTTG